MPRPYTLFTGQWDDLPCEEVAKLASGRGYDGLETALSGDHMDGRPWDEPGYVGSKLGILQSPNYDADAVHKVFGNRGHIALEVHDNDSTFGETHWGVGAQCRWRNIRVNEHPNASVLEDQ